MSTVLAYTSPAIGHLYPLTPILLELRRRGHDVHVCTLESRVELMHGLGLATRSIDPRIEARPLNDFTAKGPRQALSLVADVFAARGALEAPDLEAAISDVRPDVVIIDVNSWGAGFAAEAWGGPWATFAPYTPALHSAGTPPFGPGLAPMTGPLGAVRDAIVGRMVLGAAERGMLPRLNELRQSLGLAPVASAEEFARKAPLMLVATAKPFEYATTEWGPDVVMIGASAWEPPAEEPAWLDDITAPIVMVTTSSEFQDDTVLVRTALEAFRDQPVHVIATIPVGVPADLDVPANATVVDYVAHSVVLRRAAVAVSHGGMGATQKALAYGVPVCVVPFGRDQLEVARRVEVSRSGTRLTRKKLTPSRLRTAVDQAMGMRAGAERVSRGYAGTGGSRTAADAIEQRLLSVPATADPPRK